MFVLYEVILMKVSENNIKPGIKNRMLFLNNPLIWLHYKMIEINLT